MSVENYHKSKKKKEVKKTLHQNILPSLVIPYKNCHIEYQN